MNWFLIALINPVLHALVNHFDKFLLSKYLKGGTVGALILFSSLFAVVVLPIIYIVDPSVATSASGTQIAILMVNGAFLTLAILFYLYALDTDEASYVAPFFQLIPVFGLIFGYFILGEVLVGNQLLGGCLILLGSLLLSIELTAGNSRIKKKLAVLMIASSFFYAINAVIFKSVASDQGFINSVFWDMAGKFIFGVILFVFIRSYRKQFLYLIKSSGAKVVGLNVINEVMSLVGEFALVFAVLLAPVALVQSVGGLQPMFVLFFGIALTLLFPKLVQETLERKYLIQKIVGITVITLGVYFLEVF
jgi:drug/metabolite transporter (DMT)-like permease